MLSVQLYDIWFITNGMIQIIVETGVYGIVFFVQPGVKVNGDFISPDHVAPKQPRNEPRGL